MKKQIPYSTPEGYFENLKAGLKAIPAREGAGEPSPARKMAPYFALAATLAVAFILGGAILRKTAGPYGGQASDDEIIEYLISSNVSTLQLEDYLSYNE